MAKSEKNVELRDLISDLIDQDYNQSDIARYCGISRQRVSVIVSEIEKQPEFKAKHKIRNTLEKRLERVVYPAIQKYMLENKISVRKLSIMLGENKTYKGCVTRFLHGETKQLPIDKLNKLLELTGLTYEEVFMGKKNKPIRKIDGGDYDYHCPACDEKVGGYEITGGGDNDWGYIKHKFCPKCGEKIDWEGINTLEKPYGG